MAEPKTDAEFLRRLSDIDTGRWSMASRERILVLASRGAAAGAILEALKKWAAYDRFLRLLGALQPGTTLYQGQAPKVDQMYDDCVEATSAALALADGQTAAQNKAPG